MKDLDTLEGEEMWASRVIDASQSYKTFLSDSSDQSFGKFGEFLFERWCLEKKIPCAGEHKNGVDFIVENSLLVDVKAVRHIRQSKRTSFRRHPSEKQIPGVCYAYIIFWSDCVELKIERDNRGIGKFDCDIERTVVEQTWTAFEKRSIKLKDRTHTEFANSLKNDLITWLRHTLNVEARLIQRKVSANLNARKGGWGADNFYQNHSGKHQLVVLLGISDRKVVYVHSYPTAEWQNIEVQKKPVGTNRKEILCYYVDKLSDRYKFKDIEDFKLNVQKRFNFTEKK
jgi:hypothetical protein